MAKCPECKNEVESHREWIVESPVAGDPTRTTKVKMKQYRCEKCDKGFRKGEKVKETD